MSSAVDARRTKRVRTPSEEMTLEEHVAAKRLSLVLERREAPALRAGAEELLAKAESMTKRCQSRTRRDMRRNAEELLAEASVRESMVREHEYEVVGDDDGDASWDVLRN